MDASRRSPFQRALTTILAVVLVLGLTPSGAWAAMADNGGGGETPQAQMTLNTSGQALQEQAAGDWTGSGTEANPYVISDAEGLQKLATDVNGGNAYANKYFKLGADIDLSGIANWTPIGHNTNNTASNAEAFRGIFDGDGHTIKNMTITGAGDNTSWVTFGLFGAAQGTLKNFVVTGSIDFAAAPASTTQIYTAGVVGQATGVISFENVGSEVDITIPDFYYTGGILARASGIDTAFTGCYNKGDIHVGSTSGSNGNVGGIVGAGGSSGSSFTACYNAGDITLESGYNSGRTRSIAGIAGSWIQKSSFKSCFNFGKLTYGYSSAINNAYGAMVGYTTTSFYDTDGLSDNYYLAGNMFWDNNGTVTPLADRATGGTSFEKTTAVDAATLKGATTIAALNNAEYEAGKGYFQAGPDYPLLYWEAAGNPTITTQPEGYDIAVNGTAAALNVVAALPEAGSAGADGTLSYQWYSYAHGAGSSTATAIDGATAASYTPLVTEVGATDYYCVVTNSFTVEGAPMTASATSEVALVNVQDANAASEPTVAITLAETADQADAVKAQVSVSGLNYTDGTVAYKVEQTAEGATIEPVEGKAEVTEGAAAFDVPVDTFALGANSVKVTVTNTYQLTKTAAGEATATITISGKTVGTADELADFAAQVNAGDDFENRTVTITADIDLSALSEGKTFAPIGTNSNPFKGEIAGGKHVISGLAVSEEEYAGLVGYANGAKIHDLGVAGNVSGKNYAAGIVAYAANTTISNVANHAVVTQSGTSGAAGVVGLIRGDSSVSASYNDAAITGKGNVGGIVGSADRVAISDCYNTGTVTFAGAASDLGYSNGCAGLIGRAASSGVIIENAYNAGAVTVPEGATRSFGAIAYTQDASSTPESPVCKNVFYLEGTSTVSVGRNSYNNYDGTALYAATVKPLTTSTLPNAFTTLGANWQQAPTNYHDGYPALAWETVPAAALVTFTLTAPVENLHLSTVVDGKTVLPAAQADGTYTALLPAGTYTYTAEAFGYTTQTAEFTVAADPVNVTIPAFTESAKQAVTFVVTNSEGAAISNPTIAVENSEGVAMEAAEGTYSLPDGTYTYTVSAKGYVAKTDTLTVAGAAVEQAVTLDPLPAEWDGELVSPAALEDGAYQIGHASELAWLAQQVNAGALEAQVNAVLTNDIDLNDKAWTAIGTAEKPFVGTFDGKGFAVHGLNMVATSANDYVGLFGVVGNPETASTIKGIVVDGALDASSSHYSARIGGVAACITNTTVEECASSVSITNCTDGMKGAGGIVGVAVSGGTNTINACAFTGSIAAYTSNYGGNLGGILGKNEGAGLVIDSCYAVATIGNHYNSTGGIVGGATASGTIKNSYAGIKFLEKKTSGNIAGTSSNLTFENCYFYAAEGTANDTAVSGSEASGVTKLESAADLSTANLGDKFVSKPWVNDGVPVLTWEKTAEAAKISFTLTDAPEDTVITMTLGENDPVAVEDQEDGTFAAYIVDSAQGEYAYEAKAFGFTTKTGTVTVGAEDQTIDLGAFEPAAKQAVTFVVASSEEGVELEDLAIAVTNELGNEVEANEDGSYSLPAGTYAYKVTARKHLPATAEFTVADAPLTQNVTLNPVPAWDGEMVLEPAQVDGVFQVGNAQELAFVAALVNEAGNAADVNVVLTDDIDLNGKAWTPIGKNATNSYRGTFDGAGHSVSGLYIPDTYEGTLVGLFGQAGVYVSYSTTYPATIENLTVKGGVSAATASSEVDMGGIVGKIVATKLINCGNEATVSYAQNSGSAYLGGVVGYIDSSGDLAVTGCYNTASISATGEGAPYNMGVGGVIGTTRKSSMPIADCYNTGTITGPKWTGGIIGYSYNSFRLNNCFATGAVMCSETAGILSGRDYSNTNYFTNCYAFVPADSTCQNVYNGSATVPSGVTKVEAATDITAAALGESFKTDRVFLDATPLLAWQPKTGEPMALDAEGLTVEIDDVIGLDVEPVVTATYNGKEYTLGSDQVTLTYYTDDTYTTVAPGIAMGTNYVKVTGNTDGDFSGSLNMTFKKALTKYKPLTGTAYITVVDDGAWAKSDDGATIMVHVPLDLAAVSAVDLDEAGLGKFNLPAAEGSTYLYESTWLQAFVYTHQQYKSADDMAFGGALRGLSTNKFWGLDTRGGGDYGAGERDIHYLINGNPVVDEVLTAEAGTTKQATADAIPLNDGDFCDVGMFTNSNSYYLYSMDPNGTYWWFYDSDAEDAAITYDYETIAGASTTLNLRRTLIQVGAAGLVPTVYANKGMVVNYGTVLGTSEGVALTDEDGNLAITFPVAGTYYIWMDGNVLSEDNPFFDYADDENEMVSTPAYAKVTVKSMDQARVELAEAIQAAIDAQDGIEVSKDGTDVTTDKKWNTPENTQAVNEAIEVAEAVLESVAATPDQVAEAAKNLADATSAYQDAIADGTRPLATDEQKAEAERQVYNAERSLDNIMKSEDGSDVDEGDKWAPASAIEGVQDAIANVEQTLEQASLPEDVLQDAIDDLAEAVAVLKAATKTDALTEYKQLEGTVYVSVSYDGEFVADDNGTVFAYYPVDLAEVSQIDLDDYGYGIFKKAAPANADYQYETSVLQLAIYLHEEFAANGVDDMAGYDSDPEGNWGVPHTFGISKFWGYDNPVISYNVNAEMGATTLDGLYPEDGDIVEFSIFAGNYYGDANAGNLYFYESAAADYDAVAKEYEAYAEEPTTLNVRKVTSAFDPDTWEATYSAAGIEGLPVSYGTTYGTAMDSAAADANGNVEIAFPEAGTYYVWADGVQGAGEGVDYAVTSPAFAKVTVTEDTRAEYAELEGTAYVSVSNDGKFVEAEDGTVMARVPIDLAELSDIDLDDYGYGVFKKAASEDADYKYETSVLQLAIYLHENYFGGADDLAGYDSDPTGEWGTPHTFGISKFMGIDNPVISYNVNAEMGATTLDGLYPADGDFIEFNMFAGAYYGDANAGNLYFYENGEAAYDDVAAAFEAEPGVAAKLNIREVVVSYDPNTWASTYSAIPVEGLAVSYGTTYGEALGTAAADANGDVEITFPDTGVYIVWADGIQGKNVDFAVTSPAYAKVAVGNTAAEDEDVKQLERDIRNAERLLANTASSADGSDIADDEMWAPDEEIEALQAAIDAAKAVANDPDATAVQVLEASKALAAAKEALNEAAEEGALASEDTKDMLEDAIFEAEQTDTAGASDAAKAALAKAIADAKALVDDPKATADDVSNAMAAMQEAAEKVEDEVEAAEKAAEDAAAAKKVTDAIDALPDASKATAADAAKADAAKAAYDKLTADQKKLVNADYVTKLTNVKKATDAAKKAAADEAKNGLAKGKTFTVKTKQGTFKYKVTGTKQVTLVKASKTKKNGTVTVNKVKYNGVTYKVTAIGSKAFKSSKLKKVTVGANVKKIGKQAFVNSKLLKTFTVGKNVSKINANAFKNAKKLTKITVKSSKLNKKSTVKNALKSSKVKSVKLSGLSKAQKKKVIKAFKAAGKKSVTVK